MNCVYTTGKATDEEWVEAYKILDRGQVSYTIVRANSMCPDPYHSHVRVERADGTVVVGNTLVDAMKQLFDLCPKL